MTSSKLALPPPPFPVQFNASSPTEVPVIESVDWPASVEGVAHEVGKRAGRRDGPDWKIKTEREEYIRTLGEFDQDDSHLPI